MNWQLWWLPSGLGQVGWSELVSLLEYSRAGYAVVIGLHPVTDHLHTKTGIMMDAIQAFHEVHCEVSQRVLLVWRSPKRISTRTKIASSLTPSWWISSLWSCEWLLCRPARKCVSSHCSLSGSLNNLPQVLLHHFSILFHHASDCGCRGVVRIFACMDQLK
jgi:hypothetical protein